VGEDVGGDCGVGCVRGRLEGGGKLCLSSEDTQYMRCLFF
jgi:hypothetical protein